jgi:hypothetical protein
LVKRVPGASVGTKLVLKVGGMVVLGLCPIFTRIYERRANPLSPTYCFCINVCRLVATTWMP